MNTRFISSMRYLILVLAFFNAVELFLYEFTNKIFFQSIVDQPGYGYIFQGLIYVTLVLAILFAHEVQGPKDKGSWFILVTIWGFNLFTFLYSIGVFDFGEGTRPGVFVVLVSITLIIDLLAYFPYEHFQKHELKPQ